MKIITSLKDKIESLKGKTLCLRQKLREKNVSTKCKYIVSTENDWDFCNIIYITKGNNNNHNKSENNSNKNLIENLGNNPISYYITNDNLEHTNNDSNTSISNVNNNFNDISATNNNNSNHITLKLVSAIFRFLTK